MTNEAPSSLTQGDLIGPFELVGPLGAGGMGEVWLARHREQSIRVAIKIIVDRWANEQRYRDAFAREVRAIAGLHHPGIVDVHDYGVTGGDGRPYLVMDYAPRGSLDGLLGVMDWPLARTILLDICHALAHAHARGIIHKDLKPGNILLAGHEQVRTKLTDFGVAHALAGHIGVQAQPLSGEFDAAGVGTPSYMPPEQIRGAWRDFGPWTDLYALGCVAWELITGAPPFDAPSLVRLASLHLYTEVPRLRPRFEVPVGLERWLRRLLRKRTWERFPSAADAAWALGQLGEVEPPTWGALEEQLALESASIIDDQTETMHGFDTISWGKASTLLMHHVDAEQLSDARVTGLALTGPPVTAVTGTVEGQAPGTMQPGEPSRPLAATADLPTLRPPWREDWRQGIERAAPVLHGAGLGLYGLREIPFVGRELERDTLWAELGRARLFGPRAILVNGASGVGKSRLAEWLAERAQEVGAANAVKVNHSPVNGPRDGLSATIANHSRCLELEHDDCVRRLVDVLTRMSPEEEPALIEQEAFGLGALIAPDAKDNGSSQRERWAWIWAYMRRLASRRPLIVWIDDAQWGAEALGFVQDVLARGARDAVFFVVTVREDLLAEQGAVARSLGELAALPAVSALQVEPLDDDKHHVLVRELLGLDSSLCDQVSERTLGNPLFAVQLVGDWVDRGILVASSESGFTLADDASIELPNDLHSLWKARISRLVEQRFEPVALRAEHVWVALELAALLGQHVEQYEWETACLLAELVVPTDLVDLLIEQRLARQTPGGWELVHGMLRESLERVAVEQGVASKLHDVCVEALRTLYGEHAMGHAERVAQHLIQSDRAELALAPLIDATYHYQVSGQYERAEGILRRYEALVQDIGLDDDDLHVVRARVQRIWLEWTRHGVSAGLSHRVDEIADLASARGWDEILGEVWRWRGLVARFDSGLAESVYNLERAREHYEQVDDLEGQARCALSLAVALRGIGRLREAQENLIYSIELASRSDFFVLLPRCFGNLAEVALLLGDFDKAAERFDRARRVAEDVGDRKALAFAIGGQAELALALGERQRALALWQRAQTIFEAMGSSYARAVKVNIALVHALDERTPRARRELDEVLEEGPLREVLVRAVVCVTSMICAAKSSCWVGPESWDEASARLTEELAQTRERRHALELGVEHAASIAEVMGQHERARALRWLVLGG